MHRLNVRAQIILLFVWITVAKGWIFPVKKNEVCYGSLGCFSGDPPFTNTIGLLPHPPEKIGTRFYLFTVNSTHQVPAKHLKGEELILGDKVRRCQWRSFCRDRPIKLIIHGYMDSVNRMWVKLMVKALLQNEDNNVVVVDWSPGAQDLNYYQSAANARVVGTQVAQLLTVLHGVYGLDMGSVHMIGHSLGAQIAGYAGEFVEGIGRITGLDPAGPAFENTDEEVRLDPSDALFVDVMHTDAEHLFSLGFGLKQPIGTVDIYPNGGKDQPGCPTTYFAQMGLLLSGNFELIENVACSHLRAFRLFTESINSNCTFIAYPCSEINAKSPDACTTCERGQCGQMGYHTPVTMKPGLYYLRTNSKTPFCIE